MLRCHVHNEYEIVINMLRIIYQKLQFLQSAVSTVQQAFNSFFIVRFLMFVFNSFLLYIWSKIMLIVLLKGTDVNSGSTSNETNQ